MAWRRPGDKPLSEPMMVRSPTHICIVRLQLVKESLECWGDRKRKHLYFIIFSPFRKSCISGHESVLVCLTSHLKAMILNCTLMEQTMKVPGVHYRYQVKEKSFCQLSYFRQALNVECLNFLYSSGCYMLLWTHIRAQCRWFTWEHICDLCGHGHHASDVIKNDPIRVPSQHSVRNQAKI